MIVPGVLPGSKGPLMYTPDDIKEAAESWNGMPVTHHHPFDPVTGDPLSASSPGVLDRQGIGQVRGSKYDDRLRSEVWFDEDRTRTISPGIYESLMKGRPIGLSTGLYTRNEPAGLGAHHKGTPYTHYARGHKPDHLAILPDMRGACSLEDGCGVLINSSGELVANSNKGVDRIRQEISKYSKEQLNGLKVWVNGDMGLAIIDRMDWYDKDKDGNDPAAAIGEVAEKQWGKGRVVYQNEGARPTGDGWITLNGMDEEDCGGVGSCGCAKCKDKMNTTNAWSDAARRASAEARKATRTAQATETNAGLRYLGGVNEGGPQGEGVTHHAFRHSERTGSLSRGPDRNKSRASRAHHNAARYHKIQAESLRALSDAFVDEADRAEAQEVARLHSEAAGKHLAAAEMLNDPTRNKSGSASRHTSSGVSNMDQQENGVGVDEHDTVDNWGPKAWMAARAARKAEAEARAAEVEATGSSKKAVYYSESTGPDIPEDAARVKDKVASGQYEGIDDNHATASSDHRKLARDTSLSPEGRRMHEYAAKLHLEATDAWERARTARKKAKQLATTKNADQDANVMNRNQMISYLTSNCDCWRDGQDFLKTLDDPRLTKLVDHIQNYSHLETVVNIAHAGFSDPSGQRYRLNHNTGDWEKAQQVINRDVEEEEDESGDEEECPECGGEMVDGKCEECGYTENATTTNDDKEETSEEPEEEEEGETTNQTGASASSRTDTAYAASQDAERKGTKASHRKASNLHRAAADHHQQEDNLPMVATHKSKARYHAAKIRKATTNSDLTENMWTKAAWEASARARAAATETGFNPRRLHRERPLDPELAAKHGMSPDTPIGVLHDKLEEEGDYAGARDLREQKALEHQEAATYHGTQAEIHRLKAADAREGYSVAERINGRRVGVRPLKDPQAAADRHLTAAHLHDKAAYLHREQSRKLWKANAESLGVNRRVRGGKVENADCLPGQTAKQTGCTPLSGDGQQQAKSKVAHLFESPEVPPEPWLAKVAKSIGRNKGTLAGLWTLGTIGGGVGLAKLGVILANPVFVAAGAGLITIGGLTSLSAFGMLRHQSQDREEEQFHAEKASRQAERDDYKTRLARYEAYKKAHEEGIRDAIAEQAKLEGHSVAKAGVVGNKAAPKIPEEVQKALDAIKGMSDSEIDDALKGMIKYLPELNNSDKGDSMKRDAIHNRDSWIDQLIGNGMAREEDREYLKGISDFTAVRINNAFTDKPHDDGSSCIGEDVDDEADGGATDGDTGDYPGDRKSKGGKKTRNAATLNSYLQTAPEELRGPLASIVRDHNRYRQQVVNSLKEVAEATNNETRKKLIKSKLVSNALTTEALEELLTLVGGPVNNQGVQIPEPIFTGVAGGAPNGYTSNGGGNRNGHNPADVLQMPVINDWSENWEERESKGQG